MKPKVQDAVNLQLNEEFQSAYLYLSMAAYAESQNLKGFAHWLRMQWQEEIEHGMKFYNFLLQRGGVVALRQLDQPEAEFGSPIEIFEAVLDHEKRVTSRIHELYEIAEAEKDYSLRTLLHWFIDEQVEEEDTVTGIVEKLKLIGDSGPNLFLLDQELEQ